MRLITCWYMPPITGEQLTGGQPVQLCMAVLLLQLTWGTLWAGLHPYQCPIGLSIDAITVLPLIPISDRI